MCSLAPRELEPNNASIRHLLSGVCRERAPCQPQERPGRWLLHGRHGPAPAYAAPATGHRAAGPLLGGLSRFNLALQHGITPSAFGCIPRTAPRSCRRRPLLILMFHRAQRHRSPRHRPWTPRTALNQPHPTTTPPPAQTPGHGHALLELHVTSPIGALRRKGDADRFTTDARYLVDTAPAVDRPRERSSCLHPGDRPASPGATRVRPISTCATIWPTPCFPHTADESLVRRFTWSRLDSLQVTHATPPAAHRHESLTQLLNQVGR